jgi:hypothetical protein
LTGCDADVELMQQLLETRGFDQIQTVTGELATRDGILDAFEALIGATCDTDAVVVYYSGHGGRGEHPDWEARQAAGLPPHLQFIVPWDAEESTDDDFRGLLSEELTDLQWRLTERTANVTTILDCCHSGYMARNTELVPKAINRSFAPASLEARLRALPPARGGGGRDTNPNAVRIVACQPEQSAYERDSELPGGRHGVLTESLAGVLEDLGERPVSWAVIGRLVRSRVAAWAQQQRPEVEGPADREAFSLSVRKRPHAYPLRVQDGSVAIEAAQILGVQAGDTFRLLPPDDETNVGDAEVTAVEDDRAVLEVELAAGVDGLPPGSEAVPVATSVPQRVVRVASSEPGAAAIRQRIEDSLRIRLAVGDEAVLAEIRADGPGLAVYDGAGLRVRTERFDDDDGGRRRVIELVELLAAADRLGTLASGDGPAALTEPVTVEVTRHHGADKQEVRNGERLFVGDRISVTIRNRADIVVYAWLFDVGVASGTTLVTNDSPSGYRLAAAGSAGDGRTIGGPDGTVLAWPDGVPDDAGRPEVFVIVLADKPQDLRSLETVPETARAKGGKPRSALDALLEEARSGTREFPAQQQTAKALRYRVETVEFFLEPKPRPRLGEPEFEVDDLPDPSVRALVPRAGTKAPSKVAVRLVEMMVRKNRALFKAAVRVDALVVTRGAEGGPGIAHASTFRFPSIGDDTMLPLDDVRLYDGEVHDFLDLALWVSRDDSKGRDLADAFAEELQKPEVKNALLALGGLAIAAPQAALAFGAVAAVSVLVSAGARLVQLATGKDIGTYRTSKLAFERFGSGRTPPQGRRQAQDVEFAYEVVEL